MLGLLLIPCLLVLLLLVPGVRVVLAWMIAIVISPVYLRTRYRYVDHPALAPDQKAWSEGTSLIPSKTGALVSIGFVRRGTWVFDKADGVSVVHMEVYSHEPTRTIAAIARAMQQGAAVRTTTELVRIAGPRRISVVDHALDRERMRPGEERIEAPSITRPEWMWRVVGAMGTRHDLLIGDPLPSTTEQWTDHLTREHAAGRERMRERGVLTRPNRRGNSRLTIRACLKLGAEHLWPLKARVHQRALARERARLRDLGLESLLEEALRSPEAAAREKAAALPSGGGIPDDRGVQRPIASKKALAEDDRRFDPRFAAVVGQSQSARMRHFRRASGWLTLGITFLSIVAAIILRLPVAFTVIGGLAASLLISGLLNVGRYYASERAAAEVLIRHGLCSSCLYGLDGLTAEPDGCLVCPECGAAWNQSRVRDFTAFAPGGEGEEGLGARRVASGPR
jgi:hypothetical protein